MKIKLIFLLVLVTFNIFSQDKEALEVQDMIWSKDDLHKNSKDVPEKWLNESAVVLYKQIDYKYHKFGKKVTYTTFVRQRIKLMDKNAIKEFSTFNFKKRFYSNKGNFSRKMAQVFLGVKIIKPSGKEIVVDVEKETITQDNESKLAIANLEVGDIIDYYFYSKEPFVSKFEFIFDPVEMPLVEEYSIVDFRLNLETENDFFINFKSLNGAPNLEEIPTGKRNFRKYKLVAKDIDKKEFPRWYFPLLELPSIKMQAYFARNGSFENRTTAFLPEKESIIKSEVTKEEVLDLYDSRYKSVGSTPNVNYFLKNKNFHSNEERVVTAYYFMRHKFLSQYMEAFYANKTNMLAYPFQYYYGVPFFRNKKEFVNYFTSFLKKNKIQYEVIVATKRYNGNIKDLLIESNVDILIKVNTKNPLYASFLTPHATINYVNPFLEGTDVYSLSKSSPKNSKLDVINTGKLPVSKYTDNEMIENINLEIKPDFDGFNIVITTKFKGHSKVSEQFDRLIFSDYLYKDHKKYDTKALGELIKKKKVRAKFNKEMQALIAKLKENQKKYFENSIKSELDLSEINNYNYTITNNGRYDLKSYFTYDQNFDFDQKLIKKAGQNYIIEIGKFIGGQIEIDDKFRKRDANIYMNYPRVFNYKITLKIPEGYKVVGIDKLQKNVDNSTGAFISSAKMEGDKLIIETSKQYKNNYYPKEKWQDIIAFLDEANQFKNEKILLKRK
ncbi:MAG TPA: DUF3857 domain-containing protein [Flavobacteriia bacterium]|nr:DUF3857 domain-containing protein [Flavobacteriia bacterium]